MDSLLIKQIFVSGDTILAGTNSRIDTNKISGIYRSTDKGLTWLRIDISIGNGAIICLYADINIGNIWLVKIFNNIENGTLFKSTDLGQSWQLINQLENIPLSWLGISPFNHNDIYVKGSQYIIAGQYETVYRSLDGGNNWQEITYFPASSHGRLIGFNLSLTDSSTLYAAVDDQLGSTYFFKSTDKGDNWFYISEPHEVEPELITDDGGYSWAIADSGLPSLTQLYLSFYMDPSNKDIYYNLTKQGLFKSNHNPIYWNLVEGSDSLH